MKLTLIRHGETDWNKAKRLQGRKDVALNLFGVQQAHTCAKYLADDEFDAVFSSPLARAYRTAEIICSKRDGYVYKLDELLEIDMGDWQGMFWSEIQKKNAGLLPEFEKAGDLSKIYKGESNYDVQQRAIKFLDYIAESPFKSVLAVSHSGLIKTLVCHVLGLELSKRKNFFINNLSISTFSYSKDRGWTLLCLNQHRYLDDLFSND